MACFFVAPPRLLATPFSIEASNPLTTEEKSPAPGRRETAIRLAIVAAVGAALRLVYLWFAPPETAEVLSPLADATDYHVLALSLLEGRGFSNPLGNATAFRPPVYPVFLAAIYAIFGIGNLVAVAIVQCLLGGANAALAGICGKLAGIRDRLCIVAACIYAVYPPFVFQAPQILTEVLGRTLLFLAIVSAQIAIAKSSWRIGALSGIVFAIALLNKSVLAAAGPFWVLAFFFGGGRGAKQRALVAASFAIAAGLAILPWTVRNYVASGQLVPVSTNFPITFSHGVTRYSLYTNLWYGERIELLPPPDNLQEMTQLRNYSGMHEEITFGAEEAARARAWIAEHSGVYTVLTLRKALHFWGPFIRNSFSARAVAFVTMAPVILFGWVGFFAMWKRGGTSRTLALIAIATAIPVTIPYALSQPDVRYRLSLIDPIWIVLAVGILDRIKYLRTPTVRE